MNSIDKLFNEAKKENKSSLLEDLRELNHIEIVLDTYKGYYDEDNDIDNLLSKRRELISKFYCISSDGCCSLTNELEAELDLGLFDNINLPRLPKSVSNIDRLFANRECTTLNLSLWDLSNISSAESLFYGCNNLKTINGIKILINKFGIDYVLEDFPNADYVLSKIREYYMNIFRNKKYYSLVDYLSDIYNLKVCISLYSKYNYNDIIESKSLDIDEYHCLSIENIKTLLNEIIMKFYNITDSGYCSLTMEFEKEINKGLWDNLKIPPIPKSVKYIDTLFKFCKCNKLDLTDWDFSNVESADDLFFGCDNLKVILGTRELLSKLDKNKVFRGYKYSNRFGVSTRS